MLRWFTRTMLIIRNEVSLLVGLSLQPLLNLRSGEEDRDAEVVYSDYADD